MRQNVRLKLGICYAVVAMAVLVFVFPVFWLGLSSFKTPRELFDVALPTSFTLENYQAVLQNYEMGAFFRNSLVTAIVVTVSTVIVGGLGAYAFARYTFRGRQLTLFSVLVLRMVPGICLTIPLFLLISRFRMLDTIGALMIGQLAFALPQAVWILEGFFRGLPIELEEAALVDGCSRLQALLYVVVPISTPGLAVTGIFTFLLSWNDFALPLVLTSSPASQTLPVALSQMNLLYGIRWDHMSAASMMYMVPTIFIAIFLSRYVVQGLTLGAVKG